MEQEELFVSGNGDDHFIVDDLLDLSNGDDGETDAVNDSVSTVAESSNSSSVCEPSLADACQFSGDICVIPSEDLAELEWLSNFVEESFSSDDHDKLHLSSAFKYPTPQTRPEPVTDTDNRENDDVPVPAARARSKRSRATVSTWATGALLAANSPPVDPLNPYSPPLGFGDVADHTADVSYHYADVAGKADDVVNPKKRARRKDPSAAPVADVVGGGGGGARRCLHCAAEKTPQWRTGPMGPKTLCNACGVRYKSGRLVPEYRPASSPTFVLTKHSNSHRKVLELRRQKETVGVRRGEELLTQLRLERVLMGDVRSNGDDFLIHHHVGPDFGQLI